MSFFHGKIRLDELKNCFISLPTKWTKRNILRPNSYGLIIMKLIFLDDIKCDKFIYVSWNGLTNSSEDFVFLDRCFASKSNIQDDESILVQVVDDVNRLSPCTSCYLKPVSQDDFQLISLNSEEIEFELLNQLRIITIAFLKEDEFNVFPVWLKSSPNVPIFVKICKVDPANKTGLIITNQTRMIIVPINENIPNDDLKNIRNETKSSNSLKSVFGLFRSLIPNNENVSVPSANTIDNNFAIAPSDQIDGYASIPIFQGKPLLLRIIASDEETFSNHFTAFISKNHFANLKKLGFQENYFVAKLRKIDYIKPTVGATNNLDTSSLSIEEKFYAQFIDEFSKKFDELNEIYLLVVANEKCPENSLILDRWLIAQYSLPYLSYACLMEFNSNETSLKIEKINNINHLMVPKVKQVTLVSLNIFDVNSKNKIQDEFKRIAKETKQFKSPRTLLWNGFICNLCDKNFMIVQPSVSRQSIETNFSRMLSVGFLIDSKTEISIQKVSCLETSLLNLNTKLTKNYQTIDTFSTIHFKQILSKPFAGREETLNECLQFIKYSLNSTDYKSPLFTSMLIVGPKGSGKTSLIERTLFECWKEYSVWSHTFQCSLIKGKRIESLQKLFSKILEEAIQHQPSILIFEDLHQIALKTDDDHQKSSEIDSNNRQPTTPESFYFERVAYVFCKLLDTLRKLKSTSIFSRVSILATTESFSKLNMLIQQSNVFDKVVAINDLNTMQKIKVIEEIFNKKDFSLPTKEIKMTINFDKKRLAKMTKNFTVQQLNILIDMILHCSLVTELSSKSNNFNVINVNDAHVLLALNKFNSQFVKKTNAKLNTKRLLDDVGGLHKIKEMISDLILLQMKHPNLYRCLPMKLPNSLLFYGMPGTGKTTLVEAIANESKLNFISVKGPELLSKYIGNSEQSVRRVFKQAEEMAPCILFFDEFDSLAPRRGHDSTGVTDRVVNQMLTLLDGLEEMKHDIFIMAATSRPDLIDLALLRPGRFDQTLCCDPPNEDERKEILIALSKNLPIDLDSIPFNELIKSTENFTGADIQALLYNAFLNANKENQQLILQQQKNNNDNFKTDQKLSIKWSHIEQALEITKPSLSEKERNKFQKIYEKFRAELSGRVWRTVDPTVKDGNQNAAITLA